MENKIYNNSNKTLCSSWSTLSTLWTLPTQDNAKLLQLSKSVFERTINWNKYQPKVLSEKQNQYLYFLTNTSFWGVNKLFALSFENEDDRKVHMWYYLPKVEIKDHNFMIDGKNGVLAWL